VSGFRELAEKKLKGKELSPKLEIDLELDLEIINEDLISDCDKLRPYGKNNPCPLFISRRQIVSDIVTMGNKGPTYKG